MSFLQSLVSNPIGNAIVGKAGKAITTVGSAIHAPQLAPGGFGAQLQSLAGYFKPQTTYAAEPSNSVLGVNTKAEVLGPPGPPPGYVAPSTGGQGAGAGLGNGGATINLQQPQTSYQGPNEGDTINQLRSVYAQTANDINNQSQGLDKSYELAKSDIQSGIDQTNQAAERQKQDTETNFGDLLRQQARTRQDLNQQRQGVFSGLGTLDSSAYGEQQARADQAFQEQNTKTLTEKTKTLNDIDNQVTAFTKQAQNQLAQYALQYQQGKNAIASALAQNNLQSAAAIQSALDQIRQRAQDVQNSVIGFQNQAELLKAQGLNVRTGIAGLNGSSYINDSNNNLNNFAVNQRAAYVIPSSTVQGQGYISPGNKALSYQDLLKLQ